MATNTPLKKPARERAQFQKTGLDPARILSTLKNWEKH